MTKELLPRLGSGALREALERLRNDIDASRSCGLGGWPDQFATRLDEVEAALSLSSPIEPQSAEQLLNEFIGYISVEYEWRQERWEHCQKLARSFLEARAPSRQGAGGK